MPSKQPELVLELVIASGMATILRKQFPNARVEAHGFDKTKRRRHLPFKYEAVLLIEQTHIDERRGKQKQKAEFYLYHDPANSRAGQVNVSVYARLSGVGGYKPIWPQPGKSKSDGYLKPMVIVDLQTPESVPRLAKEVGDVLNSHVFVLPPLPAPLFSMPGAETPQTSGEPPRSQP